MHTQPLMFGVRAQAAPQFYSELSRARMVNSNFPDPCGIPNPVRMRLSREAAHRAMYLNPLSSEQWRFTPVGVLPHPKALPKFQQPSAGLRSCPTSECSATRPIHWHDILDPQFHVFMESTLSH